MMTIIATIIMVYNKFKNNLLLNLFIGDFFSVIVYYLGHFLIYWEKTVDYL